MDPRRPEPAAVCAKGQAGRDQSDLPPGVGPALCRTCGRSTGLWEGCPRHRADPTALTGSFPGSRTEGRPAARKGPHRTPSIHRNLPAGSSWCLCFLRAFAVLPCWPRMGDREGWEDTVGKGNLEKAGECRPLQQLINTPGALEKREGQDDPSVLLPKARSPLSTRPPAPHERDEDTCHAQTRFPPQGRRGQLVGLGGDPGRPSAVQPVCPTPPLPGKGQRVQDPRDAPVSVGLPLRRPHRTTVLGAPGPVQGEQELVSRSLAGAPAVGPASVGVPSAGQASAPGSGVAAGRVPQECLWRRHPVPARMPGPCTRPSEVSWGSANRGRCLRTGRTRRVGVGGACLCRFQGPVGARGASASLGAHTGCGVCTAPLRGALSPRCLPGPLGHRASSCP